MPPVTDVGNNFVIGDPKSPSHSVRSEWLLNQIRLAVATTANPPNYTAVLGSILAAVDELELKADQVNLTNAQINLNVDDVESLLATSNSRLASILNNSIDILASSLLNGSKLDYIGGLTDINRLILQHIDGFVQQLLTESIAQTITGQQAASVLSVIANQIALLMDAIGAGNISDLLLEIRRYQEWQALPLNLNDRQVFDISQIVNQPLFFPQGGGGSQREIVNCTGDRTGNPKFHAWVYGNFQVNGQGQPNQPDYRDHDFSVAPGERLNLGRQGISGFMLSAEGGGAEQGRIIVNIFEIF